METIQILRYIVQWIIILSGVYESFIIMQKKKDIKNILMGLYPAFISLYAFTVFIYDVFKAEIIIQIFLPLGIIMLVNGNMIVYFAIECILKTN